MLPFLLACACALAPLSSYYLSCGLEKLDSCKFAICVIPSSMLILAACVKRGALSYTDASVGITSLSSPPSSLSSPSASSLTSCSSELEESTLPRSSNNYAINMTCPPSPNPTLSSYLSEDRDILPCSCPPRRLLQRRRRRALFIRK